MLPSTIPDTYTARKPLPPTASVTPYVSTTEGDAEHRIESPELERDPVERPTRGVAGGEPRQRAQDHLLKEHRDEPRRRCGAGGHDHGERPHAQEPRHRITQRRRIRPCNPALCDRSTVNTAATSVDAFAVPSPPCISELF